MKQLTYLDVQKAAVKLAKRITEEGKGKAIYAIPRGGVPAAMMVMNYLPPGFGLVDCPSEADIFIDELVDSGTTARLYSSRGKPFYALYSKSRQVPSAVRFAEELSPNCFVVFPWEGSAEGSATDIGIRLLQYIGEDPSREGLAETPARFLKAWAEWTRGYKMDVDHLFKDFGDGAENYDEMVMVDPIPFYSHCEHHLAAIFGTVHLAYIPSGRIAGLSKFCRLVDAFACRLQVQERLTVQIADSIVQYLAPIGCGVVVRARHFCMESRGAKKPGTETQTIALRGCMKDEPSCRAEFLSLIKGR